jgi:hypothetical protein
MIRDVIWSAPLRPPESSPNIQDGHVSISRRGLLAAGLAVAVVGTLGVVSTMNAGAAETPAAPAVAQALADTPPPLLPWGAKPHPIRKGPRGASSRALARSGASAADNPTTPGSVTNFGPKGQSDIRTGTTSVPPLPPTTAKADSDVDYLYTKGKQYSTQTSAASNLTVAAPKVGSADWHSLAEVALETADEQQIVEVGWNVDQTTNGDLQTHLFVYHWTDGVQGCYNGCGFVPYGDATVTAGATLATGVIKPFGIQHFNGSWWIAYDSEFIGSFPDSVWNGKFTQAGLIQVFGEVAASSLTPCTEMGNGQWGSADTSAKIGPVTYGDGSTVQLAMASTTDVYTVAPATARTFHYGGPAPTKC